MWPEREDNLAFNYHYDHGDVAAGEAESDAVVEGTYRLHYVTHACLGTSGIVAAFDSDGRLTLHSVTQVPFLYRRDMSRIVGVPPEHIRVIQAAIGGGFGSKLDIYPYEPIAIFLARATGRPVRILFDRGEEFRDSPTRQPAIVHLRSGARRDGTLTFRTARLLLDNGAHTSWGATTPFVMMQTFSSLYRVPHAAFDAEVVYTHNPYAGSFRGYGNLQATFPIEVQLDELAESLGIDPLELRLRNAQVPGEVTGQGLVFQSCGLAECLRTAAAASGWEEKRRAYAQAGEGPLRRGIGMASMVHTGGGAKIYHSDGCGTVLTVDDFGSVTLVTGATEIGQGSETVLAQIAAEELGIPVDRFTVVNSDTQVKPWDVGVHASRTTFIAGNAARMAANKARRKLLDAAAEQLGVPAGDLEIRDGDVVRASDGKVLTDVGRVVRKLHFATRYDVVTTTAYYEPPSAMQDPGFKGNVSPTYSFATHVVEVEVDVETGVIRPLRVTAVHDAGRVINPLGALGQVEGGVAMGLGYAMTEDLVIREGRVLNGSFRDYKLFTAPEMPEVDVRWVETADPDGPFGAKGIGEAPAICIAPAVVNAVYQATGRRFRSLPLRPERVALELARGEGEE
ncbi:molybdopterin-dependent oxidoreductase [Myxococcota bacterium]|nr:molybdopterin-dependent oxidoreductase [Myxococcota bacterium]